MLRFDVVTPFICFISIIIHNITKHEFMTAPALIELCKLGPGKSLPLLSRVGK